MEHRRLVEWHTSLIYEAFNEGNDTELLSVAQMHSRLENEEQQMIELITRMGEE